MSRIGKKPINIPSGVDVKIDGQTVKVKGPKGELKYSAHPTVKIELVENQIILTIPDNTNKYANALWGTNRQMVANLITGVTEGYVKILEINGVGYRVEVKGDIVLLNVGYSHPVEYKLPVGVSARSEKNILTLESIDKQLVGEVAANIRKIKKPEPYKGKGIKYSNEVIIRKAGKQVKTRA